MEDEIKTPENPEVDYIETINQLKQNTVAKDQYNKLKEENQRLLQSILNGEAVDVSQASKPSFKELQNDLYGVEPKEITNLEGWTKFLEFRKQMMERIGDDPCVPHGHQVTATASDYEKADRVCSIIEELIEKADGDPVAFTSYMDARMKPTKMDSIK